jgi:hypothetical protein
MLDSGAGGYAFINPAFLSVLRLDCVKMDGLIRVVTADGESLGHGIITHKTSPVQLQISGHVEIISFLVVPGLMFPMILGIEWLEDHNPEVDWKTKLVSFNRCECQHSEANFDLPEDISPLESMEEDSILIGVFRLSNQKAPANAKSFENLDMETLFKQFPEVFSDQEFPALPPRRTGVDMEIELLDGKAPPFGPLYSLSVKEEEELRRYLEGALKAGIIQTSKSPAGSPVLFVTKPDGSLRLCVDYRGLNAITKSNRAALPLIRDLLMRASGNSWYSKIDLKSAFNLVRIAEGHEEKTAFRTKYGHFEYLVMPFGLKNAPSHFQSFMNSIFGDMIDLGLVLYLDDLLIFTSTREEHEKLIQEVFSRLSKHGLKVNLSKCQLYVKEVNLLGHKLTCE